MRLAQLLLMTLVLLAGAGSRAETGVSDKEIIVGQFAAMSGPAAQLGQRLNVGIQAYFKSVNEQGGVNGRTLRLLTRDDGYEPDKAVAAVKGLIEQDQVFALVGSVGTPTGLAALPVFTAAKVPMVGMFTGAQGLREPFNRYVFHVRSSYFDETERIVQHLTTLGVKKIAVFYQNDAYGKAGLEGMMRALTKRQLKPAGTATVERNTVDVAAALNTLLPAQPEAVVQIGAYKACAEFIKQARARGYGGQFFNVSFVGSKALADELGPAGMGVVISQVVPFPYIPSSPVVREYQQRMKESGQTEFDFSSMEGFLIGKVFVEGVRRAGKNLTRDALITALESMKDVNLGGFEINYSPRDHSGSKYTDLTIIGRDGRFVR
ncbi:ABC transporter substrate-binding protein [Rhodoferax sp. BAB1]|uniref:ABC transporter substrate-binding protein n=1 Tax=Rhodoferax sp. BAB1 TaxID=2741720 RepID=UPI0015760B30|nr:ABC transporter substrate-binding protein [Rhodoferax sp. BAB1]QKO23456.1 ABC transporter substrate-binding protein [Rhodoferax sp. BAB1]